MTLLETLVVVSIISVLMGIMLPALSSARSVAKELECSSNMRSVAVEFTLFAEGESDGGRGDSERLGRNRFWIGDFQDKLYGIDEFWDLGTRTEGAVKKDRQLMLCPAGASDLVKRKGRPCSLAALGPSESVSVGVNMRLHRSAVEFKGRHLLAPAAATHVLASILNHPYVPLAMDVDGSEAAQRGIEPFYSAPPISGHDDAYANGRYWAPATRHGGKTNVAFAGGHVLSSTDPRSERWDWAYQADAGR